MEEVNNVELSLVNMGPGKDSEVLVSGVSRDILEKVLLKVMNEHVWSQKKKVSYELKHNIR